MKLNNLKLSDKVIQRLKQVGSLKNIEFLSSKSGLLTIRKNGILIHSLYDPVKEAENLVNSLGVREEDNYVFVLFGVGVGYVLDVLKQKFPNSVIIPIELDDDVALAFLQNRNDHIITNYNLTDIYTILNFTDFMTIKDVKFVYLPSVYRINKDKYENIREEVLKVVKSKFSDLLTRVNFDKLWVKNAFLNVPYLVNYGSISYETLKAGFESLVGKPYVVLGAGYSGIFLLDVIKKYRDKIVLCVVDTALKTVLDFGIKPDFVFSLDSQFSNLKDFFGIDTSNLILLADILVSPELIRNFKGRVFLTKSSHLEIVNDVIFEMTNNAVSWIEEKLNYRILSLESGGSVSTNLFHFALLMGGDPVFLVGVDLGFPYIVSHSLGTPSHEFSVLKGDIFRTSDTFLVSSVLTDYVFLEGVKDKECITHRIMETYKLWFDSASDTSDLKNVYNISDGVKLKGITNLSTSEGKDLFVSIVSNKTSVKTLNFDVRVNISKSNIVSEFKKLKNYLEDVLHSFSETSFREIVKEYPFIINLTSKSLFSFYRGNKSFDECLPDVVNDIKYLIKVIDYSLDSLR